ncbi:MAG: branched-chain amino acid ABC transporter substrate-binding protein [Thermodesulfobacteriota bacterium]
MSRTALPLPAAGRGFVLLAALAWALLAGCGREDPPVPACPDPLGCVEVAPGEPLVVGVLEALSGEPRPIGLDQLRAVELAVESWGGGMLGHDIVLAVEDSHCSKEGGVTAALKLAANPKVLGAVGPTCSGAAVSAGKVLSDAGMVLVSGSSTAPVLTRTGDRKGAAWQPGFMRTAQNDEEQGRAAAQFAFHRLGVRRAASIHDGDPYTRGLAEAFDAAFAALGGEVALSTGVNKGDRDMQPVLAAVAASGARFLFAPVFRPEGDRLVLQARKVKGLEDAAVMSSDGLFLDGFLDAVGDAGRGLYFVLPATPEGKGYEAFVARYRERYGEAPNTSYHAHTYDAANMLLDAVRNVAASLPGGGLRFGRQALRDKLRSTRGYAGLTGTLACDEFGDCGSSRFKVLRLDDPSGGMEALRANEVFRHAPR